MIAKANSQVIDKSEQPKRDIRWIYRKFAQAGLGAALIVIVIGMWHSTTQRGAETFEQHAYMLVRQIVKQAELPVINAPQQNPEDLKAVADYLAASNFIIDASIYSDNGQLIAQSDQALSIQQAVGLENPPEETRLFPIVEPIQQDGKTLGYIRVTFDYDAVQEDSKQFQDDFSGLTRLMLFLCALIGILFTRAFSVEGK